MKICSKCKFAKRIWTIDKNNEINDIYQCKSIYYKRHVVQCGYENNYKQDINWDIIEKYPFSTTNVTDRCAFYKGGEPK